MIIVKQIKETNFYMDNSAQANVLLLQCSNKWVHELQDIKFHGAQLI